jgi:hypothetical protein
MNLETITNFFILSYNQTGRYTYSGGSATRLVRSSSHSGVVDEYGEQQALYDRSPNNSSTFVYGTTNYGGNQNYYGGSGLTEEMLLRSHANSGGKFPTHLLTKLGSQIYDMPSDQVDMTHNNRRTGSTTRYYTVNQGERGYESVVDDANDNTPRYSDEKYVQIKASDLKDVLANYDVYSNSGQKLEGEQLTF